MTRVSLACARPPPGGPDRVFPASRPSRGVVSCVALGLPGHPPKGVVPRYPPRGVLRDCSRPVPGSCRGVVSPLTGGFPHRPHEGGGPPRGGRCERRAARGDLRRRLWLRLWRKVRVQQAGQGGLRHGNVGQAPPRAVVGGAPWGQGRVGRCPLLFEGESEEKSQY